MADIGDSTADLGDSIPARLLQLKADLDDLQELYDPREPDWATLQEARRHVAELVERGGPPEPRQEVYGADASPDCELCGKPYWHWDICTRSDCP